MPFDYMWKFLNYTVSNDAFYEGKTQLDKTQKYFDFEKEITLYSKLEQKDQLFETAKRVEKSGLKNRLISSYYQNKKEHWSG